MAANTPDLETDLVKWAIGWLKETLPQTWSIGPRAYEASSPTRDRPPIERSDALIEIRPPGAAYATVVIEARKKFGPLDVDRLLGGVSRQLREFSPNVQILVVAPWLSTRTRQLLEAEGINYLDQSGNALVKTEQPSLFIKTVGLERNPSAPQRGRASLKGRLAARLIRLLTDVQPPYGVRELAQNARLTAGYVSRLLDTLEAEALIQRRPRGPVETVDVPGLIRKWAEAYDVFSTNVAEKFIAAAGARSIARRLKEGNQSGDWTITGSFAAVEFSPVAAPTLLLVYARDATALSTELGLLRADEGSDVVLLRPFDTVVWARRMERNGVPCVAPAQLAVDCLTGVGRMPTEGEAILAWMMERESEWRFESLADLSGAKPLQPGED